MLVSLDLLLKIVQTSAGRNKAFTGASLRPGPTGIAPSCCPTWWCPWNIGARCSHVPSLSWRMWDAFAVQVPSKISRYPTPRLSKAPSIQSWNKEFRIVSCHNTGCHILPLAFRAWRATTIHHGSKNKCNFESDRSESESHANSGAPVAVDPWSRKRANL